MPGGSRDRNPKNPFQSGRALALGLFLLVLAALPRIALVERQGLWSDETFSLAIATGHSLEHPASEARPELGDYVEPPRPVPAGVFQRYLRHESPAASPGRVIRAVLLSDTSPPLYYLLLSAWTRVFGTSDAALRLFSVFCTLACLPLLWALARETGGEEVALPATVLFALAPASLYHSTEGRMYPLVWLLACLLAWTGVALSRRGVRPGLLLLFVLTGAAGLLTHYFFVFVWCAVLAWLAWRPGALSRGVLALAILGTGLLVLPWMAQVSGSLSRWRVTAGWLDEPPPWQEVIFSPLKLAWSFFSVRGMWGNPPWIEAPVLGVFLLLGLAVVATLRRVPLDRERIALPVLWVLAVCLGPLAFDLVLQTKTQMISRYALAGLPAAMILAGAGLARLHPGLRAAFLAAILLAWLPGQWDIFRNPDRQWLASRTLARDLEGLIRPGDLAVLHSIPSGVLSIARYLNPQVELLSWVERLGVRRVPGDLERAGAGSSRVILVKFHLLGEPLPEEEWLRKHLTLEKRWNRGTGEILLFAPPPPAQPAGEGTGAILR